MNTEEYLGALDQYLSEREANRKRANELMELNRLNQVEYPETNDSWFVPKMIGKGLYQWLSDDTELNRDMGTPGLKEGAQFAMMAPLMAIPGALGGGALTRSLTGAGLNVLSGVPFYATDPNNADVLMDATIGAGIGAGGIPGAILGGMLGWSPEPETGEIGREEWAPYEEYPSGRRGQRFAGGGLVRSLGRRATRYLNEVKDPLVQAHLTSEEDNLMPELGEFLTMDEIKKLREGKPWTPLDNRPEFANGGSVTSQQIITQHGGRIEKSKIMTPKDIIAHHGGRYA